MSASAPAAASVPGPASEAAGAAPADVRRPDRRSAQEAHQRLMFHCCQEEAEARTQARTLMSTFAFSSTDLWQMLRGQIITDGRLRPCMRCGDDDEECLAAESLPVWARTREPMAPAAETPEDRARRPSNRLRCPLEQRGLAGEATVPCSHIQYRLGVEFTDVDAGGPVPPGTPAGFEPTAWVSLRTISRRDLQPCEILVELAP